MATTLTLTPAGNPILTWELRYDLTEALVEMIEEDRSPRGAGGYLDILQRTAPDTEITPEHELADVLQYFGIHEY